MGHDSAGTPMEEVGRGRRNQGCGAVSFLLQNSPRGWIRKPTLEFIQRGRQFLLHPEAAQGWEVREG